MDSHRVEDSNSGAKSRVMEYAVEAGAAAGGAAAGAGAVVNATTVATYTTWAGHTFMTGTAASGPVATFLAANPIVAPAVGAAIGAYAVYRFVSWLLRD